MEPGLGDELFIEKVEKAIENLDELGHRRQLLQRCSGYPLGQSRIGGLTRLFLENGFRASLQKILRQYSP